MDQEMMTFMTGQFNGINQRITENHQEITQRMTRVETKMEDYAPPCPDIITVKADVKELKKSDTEILKKIEENKTSIWKILLWIAGGGTAGIGALKILFGG